MSGAPSASPAEYFFIRCLTAFRSAADSALSKGFVVNPTRRAAD
jgi:hypothetical protein